MEESGEYCGQDVLSDEVLFELKGAVEIVGSYMLESEGGYQLSFHGYFYGSWREEKKCLIEFWEMPLEEVQALRDALKPGTFHQVRCGLFDFSGEWVDLHNPELTEIGKTDRYLARRRQHIGPRENWLQDALEDIGFSIAEMICGKRIVDVQGKDLRVFFGAGYQSFFKGTCRVKKEDEVPKALEELLKRLMCVVPSKANITGVIGQILSPPDIECETLLAMSDHLSRILPKPKGKRSTYLSVNRSEFCEYKVDVILCCKH